MPGPYDYLRRDRAQWSTQAPYSSPRDASDSRYRTRSTSQSHYPDTRSRSPRRSHAPSPDSSRSRQPSSHNSSSPLNPHSTRYLSSSAQETPHTPMALNSTPSSSAGSSSHAHRSEGGHYYGSSVWSSEHGVGMGSAHSSASSARAPHRRNQESAPHLYGDDELPLHSTASEYHRREPQQPPSYSSSRNSAWQQGSMPPPYSSGGSSSRQGSRSPGQFPPTRRAGQFYADDEVTPRERNWFIEKWRHGE